MATKKSTTKKTKPNYTLTFAFDGATYTATGNTLAEALRSFERFPVKGKATLSVEGKENGSVVLNKRDIEKMIGSDTGAEIHAKRVSQLIA